ncbi:hypothetical protein TYRP_001675 [Tyrophagus putrescentiae]|nr:hypothetical protein TYRP_001675 [Tyrophagus putrescentiae]
MTAYAAGDDSASARAPSLRLLGLERFLPRNSEPIRLPVALCVLESRGKQMLQRIRTDQAHRTKSIGGIEGHLAAAPGSARCARVALLSAHRLALTRLSGLLQGRCTGCACQNKGDVQGSGAQHQSDQSSLNLQ